MANKLTNFLKEKVLTFLIQFTIGLIFPWWLIDIINRNLIEGYSTKFEEYSKIGRFTYGLILPWWVIVLAEGNKMQNALNDDSDYENETIEKKKKMKTNKVYCKYCGGSWAAGSNITGNVCPRHPNGAHKGYHAPYEGGLKDRYTCKYCMTNAKSIESLTSGVCSKHPNGAHKGHHEPML